jgi:hypothetical protein
MAEGEPIRAVEKKGMIGGYVVQCVLDLHQPKGPSWRGSRASRTNQLTGTRDIHEPGDFGV